ncbi:MAG: flagellar biosynthesis anti-sigma factor FlgM [Peptococcaceae bacterium]|nr:flagellar biosynthesis anti-sigma factor FlgM [Peptococcaceae bacterium]
MKINGYPNIQEIMKAYASQKRKQPAPGEKVSPAGREDTLDLSVQAMEMKEVRASLKDVREVREETVDRIKKEIGDGTYKADAWKIAQGIISERLLDRQA